MTRKYATHNNVAYLLGLQLQRVLYDIFDQKLPIL